MIFRTSAHKFRVSAHSEIWVPFDWSDDKESNEILNAYYKAFLAPTIPILPVHWVSERVHLTAPRKPWARNGPQASEIDRIQCMEAVQCLESSHSLTSHVWSRPYCRLSDRSLPTSASKDGEAQSVLSIGIRWEHWVLASFLQIKWS